MTSLQKVLELYEDGTTPEYTNKCLTDNDWDELKEMTTVTSGDLASAIAVTVLEENDRNLLFFEI